MFLSNFTIPGVLGDVSQVRVVLKLYEKNIQMLDGEAQNFIGEQAS